MVEAGQDQNDSSTSMDIAPKTLGHTNPAEPFHPPTPGVPESEARDQEDQEGNREEQMLSNFSRSETDHGLLDARLTPPPFDQEEVHDDQVVKDHSANDEGDGDEVNGPDHPVHRVVRNGRGPVIVGSREGGGSTFVAALMRIPPFLPRIVFSII